MFCNQSSHLHMSRLTLKTYGEDIKGQCGISQWTAVSILHGFDHLAIQQPILCLRQRKQANEPL